MVGTLGHLVDTSRYDLGNRAFQDACRASLDQAGALVLPAFLTASALECVRAEGEVHRDCAFYTTEQHNVFLTPADPRYSGEHPRNRMIDSSKGCIPDDVVPSGSPLRLLYCAEAFKAFLCSVLGEQALYPYADPLSSINIHYASEGQELGWHFDNSSFAITLLIQAPEAGGIFEYVSAVRDAGAGEMNYSAVAEVLDGETIPEVLDLQPGGLVLFRGRNAMHRVTPVMGGRTRMLVVLAYNAEPGVSLSESARMTFYGRLR